MTEHKTTYRSRIDWWVWCIFIFVIAVIICIAIGSPWWLSSLYGVGILTPLIIGTLGIKYTICGHTLTVYQFYRPLRLPIDKIKEIRYCRSYLAGAAMSSRRLSIKFSDPKVLKSFMPIEISPLDRDGFVRQLKEINPDIIIIGR